ncbi:MAG: hypothetical protein NVV82_19855 [Sporocytophaga sp.]|nr:hypothetical protein [Sporocytophaga sp.]
MSIGYEDGTQCGSDQNLDNIDSDLYGLRLILGFRRLMNNSFWDFHFGPGYIYNHWKYQITDHYGGSSSHTLLRKVIVMNAQTFISCGFKLN